MSWLKEDDQECIDPAVGSLTDREYRARKALMEYCAREHVEDGGVFHQSEIRHAIYATPSGPKAPTEANLIKFRTISIVIPIENYDESELKALGIDRPEGEGYYRFNKWEKYNPPRDKTATERKQAERSRKRHGLVTEMSRRDTRDSHGPSRAAARVRSRPVPSQDSQEPAPGPAPSTTNNPARDATTDNGAGAGADDLTIGKINPTAILANLDPGDEPPL